MTDHGVRGMRVLMDGREIARHNGPLFDHRGRVTPGTSWWWLHTTMRTVLPSCFVVEFFEAPRG